VFDGWVEENVETVLRSRKRNIHISENERYNIPGFIIYFFSTDCALSADLTVYVPYLNELSLKLHVVHLMYNHFKIFYASLCHSEIKLQRCKTFQFAAISKHNA
jgi:hypothetical protein